VLPANNPIRVAEDIAMLDHITGERANAGFAPGYQRRWVDAMAKQTHGVRGALPHQHDGVDRGLPDTSCVRRCPSNGSSWKEPSRATAISGRSVPPRSSSTP
jgi:hypothetical protein